MVDPKELKKCKYCGNMVHVKTKKDIVKHYFLCLAVKKKHPEVLKKAKDWMYLHGYGEEVKGG